MYKQRKYCLIQLSLILFLFTQSIFCFEIKGAPIQRNYILPAEGWYFIEEDVEAINSTIDFEWTSDVSVQGREVSEEDYNTLFNLDLLERSTYFETLTFNEGTYFIGAITSNNEGKVFFVFFNPNNQDANLILNLTVKEGGLKAWVVGLVITIVGVVFLSLIIWVTIRIRKKMIEEAQKEEELTPQQKYMQM